MKKKIPSQKDIPTPTERAVHTAGKRLQKANPRMSPTWEEIAEQIGKRKGTVSNAMQGLKRKGLADWNPAVRRSAEFF